MSHTKKNEENDGRRDRPTASPAKFNIKCHFRHRMNLPFKDTSSKAASDGTDQHEWMEDDTFDLRPDLLPACKEAEQQRNQVIGLVWSDWQNHPPEVHIEERLWYRGDKYSGKADYVGIRDGRALVIDYKFGRGKVDDASCNDQLLWLAVLVFTNFPKSRIKQITVAIVQPHCGPPSVHTYTAEQLQRARRRILYVIRQIDSEQPRLVAGPEQCKWCKAIAVCPAAAAKRNAIARIDEHKVHTLTNAHLSGLLDAVPVVRQLCEKLEVEAVLRLREHPESINGYEVKKGNTSRRIKDSAVARDKLLAAKVIDAAGIEAASSLGLGKLKGVVREYNEVGASAADKIIKEALGETLEAPEGRDKVCRIES